MLRHNSVPFGITLEPDTRGDTSNSDSESDGESPATKTSRKAAKQHAKARCAFFAWAKFGTTPFTVTELINFIELNKFWREDTPFNQLEASQPDSMIIISSGDCQKGVRSNINRLKKHQKIFVDDEVDGMIKCHEQKMLHYLQPFGFTNASEWMKKIKTPATSIRLHKRLSIQGTDRIIRPISSPVSILGNEPRPLGALEALKTKVNHLKIAEDRVRSIEQKAINLKRKFTELVDDVAENKGLVEKSGEIMTEIVDTKIKSNAFVSTRNDLKSSMLALRESIETSIRQIDEDLRQFQ